MSDDQVMILIGYGDETWDIAVAVPMATVEKVIALVRRKGTECDSLIKNPMTASAGYARDDSADQRHVGYHQPRSADVWDEERRPSVNPSA